MLGSLGNTTGQQCTWGHAYASLHAANLMQVSGAKVLHPGAVWPSSYSIFQDAVLEHCYV